MSQEKFTNIVGVPLKKYVKEQLYTRSFQGSTIDSRTNDQIMYLANKTCWIRLVSFVDVGDDQLRRDLDIEGKQKAGTPTDVSKQWILFGGTSYISLNRAGRYQNNNINLRSGIESNDPSSITNNSAYGLGGVDQFGYRPMPGIISATIEHAGTAGSLRIANIKFKVWNINQLNAIDLLYFRLGYSCLLEWGHTTYLDNNNKLVTIGPQINPLDVFNNDLYKTKEGILRGISDKRVKSFGNYDGLYGLISNYEWSQAEDGSYDCNVKLTGLGSVIDSLKINQAFSMPGGGSESAIQNINDNTTQKVSDTIIAPPPTDPYILQGRNSIAWPDIGEIINSGENVLINFEKLQKRKNDLQQLINQSIISEDKGVNIKFIYTNSKGNTLSKSYLINNPLLKPGQIGYSEIDYNRLIQISNNELKQGFYVSSQDYLNLKTEQEIKLKQWTLESATPKLIKLTKKIPLKSEEKIIVFTGTGTGDSASGFADQDSVEFINTDILIEITFNADYSENFEILRPVTNLNQGAGQIKSPALRRYYLNFALNVWNAPDYNKILSLKEELITISKLSARNVNDNTIKISALIETEDVISKEGYTPGFRTQKVQETVKSIFDKIESYNNGTNEKVFFTILPANNDSIYNGDTYKKSKTQKRLDIATIIYNFDEKKLLNSSNTEGYVPGESLDSVQSSIPEQYFSNIDKFLIDLRDFASASPNSTGEVSGSYEFITEQLKNGPLDPIRINNQNTVFSDITSDVTSLGIEKQLAFFINKGFNSEVLSGELKSSEKISNVNFQELFKVYKAGLEDNDNQGKTSKFCYIKLGLLLYYINNNSIFYEKNTDGKIKKPFIYIDFNPETNYCFTTPYQLSIDPGVCMIKININNQIYQKLFPENAKPINPFNNKLDAFSPNVQSGFGEKEGIASLRGKLMNIPVNIDHVINIIQSQSNSNSKTDVYLRSFLEILMDDINKSLGNINSFRVGYYDDANTVRIYDDQMINPPSNQSTISSNGPESPLMLTEPTVIPIIGKNSIVRSLQLKTEVSTKMSQMIAFSSQAGNLGSLNTDSSALGYNNDKLIDRVLPVKETATNTSGSNNNATKSNINADKDAATVFNSTVIEIYNRGIYTKSNVNTSKVYYTTAANNLKAGTDETKARQVLPISINIGMDGISGMSLLEGFTVPKDVLPTQYLDTKGFNRVGFAVAGLNHTIDNNQWVTSIRGQMINIPISSPTNANNLGNIDQSIGGGQPTNNTSINSTASDTSFIGTNTEAKKIAEQYLGRLISSIEWSQLISATFAEASNNQTERAYVMGAILNRTRSKSWGQTITNVLTAKNQFQAVTGTRSNPFPSKRYINGPNPTEADNIYGAAINLLNNVPKNIINFTAADIKSYGPGTRPKYRQELFARGGFIIGKTIFST